MLPIKLVVKTEVYVVMGTNGTILRRNADVSFKEEGDLQKIGVNLTAFLNCNLSIFFMFV